MTRRMVYKAGDFRDEETPQVLEKPLTVFYNDGEIVTLLTSGDHIEELAVGFLVSEGVLDSSSKLKSVDVDPEGSKVFIAGDSEIDESGGPIRRILTSGCGKGTVFYESIEDIRLGRSRIKSDLSIPPQRIVDWMRKLTRGELPEELSRGVHACLLVSPDDSYLLREDVGRHNALDKIIGRAYLDRQDLSHTMLFTTGRLTSEVVLKVHRVGIPAVLSRSAATDLSEQLARQIDLTLVGYVRGERFVIYAGADRIKDSF